MKYSTGLLVCSVCVCFFWQTAGAIVIRHDRDDAEYQLLAANFPATAVLSTDGTGVLVGSRWVLTAAHVGKGAARRKPSVRIGESQYDIVRLYIHPEWTSMGPHDVALLELADSVTAAQPVGLYSWSDEPGQISTFAGAGNFGTGMSGPRDTDGLMRAATNEVDSVDATWLYFTFDRGETATELEGISGPGDSGGPAYVRRNGRLYTVGVSSIGMGTGEGPGKYGARELYTRVSTHLAWIQATMAGENQQLAVVPGEHPEVARPGQAVAVTVGLAGLPDSQLGRQVAGFLEAYNSGDVNNYIGYLRQQFTAEYWAAQPDSAHRSRYGRLRNQYFGDLTLLGIKDITATAATIVCEGALGQQAELKFKTEYTEPFKVSELDVFMVEVDRR